MIIRKTFEEAEEKNLAPGAALSARSRGRLRPEEECHIRTAFQRDRDRIIHSESFRRLKHKTQVFLITLTESHRTRLTHTIEVSQIARTIAKALSLNEDLTEAIALGHDLGHAPFGHVGEQALDQISSCGFKHNYQSLRVVEALEKKGQGLNLTFEVKDGIVKHSRGATSLSIESEENKPVTLEGAIVRLADSIAYINHDIQDALSAGLIKLDDLPDKALAVLGRRYSERIDTMVRDTIEASWNKGHIRMSDRVLEATDQLRSYLYRHVYPGKQIQVEAKRASKVIKELFGYYMEYPAEVKRQLYFLPPQTTIERLVCDYLAWMSDYEALRRYKEIFLPKPWLTEGNLEEE
ncbi:MAG: deoxyguanosinetriphosphate triphosphohydrolase [bacterium]|nr:deoxyguanosinetriphosphate triphosphohydrolase [bacterium]